MPIADAATLSELVTQAVFAADFRRATFAGKPRQGPTAWQRVVIRPVTIRGTRHLQFSYFDGRKDITHNHLPESAHRPLDVVVALGFAGVHLSTDREELDLRLTKKGKLLIGRKTVSDSGTVATEPHNRVKELPLPEGRADHLLAALGIADADGRIRPTMRAKFRQINEFLVHLRHGLDDARLLGHDRPIRILDAGSGSGYLTLAAHHYLNDILTVSAEVVGVDINAEVIRKSAERSHQLGAEGLSFACTPIANAQVEADVVLALHACDTATDAALAQAIRCGAKLILSVPCCHHHLNASIRPEGAASVLRPILRHGILKQRTADIVTDAFRALALRILGYRTDVIEFISPEHTARNLMIRAVAGATVGETAFVTEWQELRQFWNVEPYLERILGETLTRWLPNATSPTLAGTRDGECETQR
ncbi:MAG: SAM-dependent methyltransferase [Bacteroidales bacterium]|nr:SAM-dependent methyltransferase [Bacteroidales bacterium]